MRPLLRFISVLIISLLSISNAAYAWWNKDWNYRKEFIIDTSATGVATEQTVNDVAVLVKLHLGNFTYFTDTKPNGEDIRFVSGDDLTPLKYHIEYYDPLQQVGLIWVKLPRITPGTNLEKIYMYYGNENAVNGEDITGTYGVDHALVYHFDGVPADSTAYANNPAANSSIPVDGAVVGSAAEFQGQQNITVPLSPSLRLIPDPGVTASLWLKQITEQSNAAILSYVGDDGNSLALRIDGIIPYLQFRSSTGDSVTTPLDIPAEITLDSWHHLAFNVTAEQMKLYLNGVEVSSAEIAAEEIGGLLSIGAWADGSQGFVGQIDELKILKRNAGTDWLALQFDNQGPSNMLVRAGADGQQEGAGGEHNYIAFSLSKLTLEGKITTGTLTAMLIFAIFIMIGKGMFLGKVRKSNRLFQKRYAGAESGGENNSHSLISTYKKINVEDKKLKDSPLNRVFTVGMKELHARLTAKSAGAAGTRTLTLSSINALRASMNTSMLRENQRLQKQMVLLTIAIAGGPFIGLFGTVMGVMITFAEVALAGNVDVNAIAPGISAALVATVAGLAVAIPCLFGYNYLSSQIKEVSADMRVFADEFESRVSEEFGE